MASVANFYTWIDKNPMVFSLFLLWLLVWKGLALWKSARKGSVLWFIVLMTVNTVSILEILYITVLYKIDTSKLEAWIRSKLKFLKLKK